MAGRCSGCAFDDRAIHCLASPSGGGRRCIPVRHPGNAVICLVDGRSGGRRARRVDGQPAVSAVAIVLCLATARAALGGPATEGGQSKAPATGLPQSSGELQEVMVTAERRGLIGQAATSSQGLVVNDELALTPAFRPAQLLETTPGLVVTSHSGEGKANQYLLRGVNLDHGTDLAIMVDGMPFNQPTHAHGQGYADLNFMIPELATNLKFTKGPYFAQAGDFASIGSVEVGYVDLTPDQVTVSAGSLGFERMLASGSTKLGPGHVLGALELQHYDGPWRSPDDQRKLNSVLRYSTETDDRGYSLTAMFSHDLWNSTTDQPTRAISSGLVSRFGSLDPSDGGQTQRASVSARYHNAVVGGLLSASAYLVTSHLTLWNDFTHILTDPVNSDQEAQRDDRTIVGGAADILQSATVLGVSQQIRIGVQARGDSIVASRLPTRNRELLSASAHPVGFSERDRVRLASVGLYAEASSRWRGWLRTVLGVREDYVHESSRGSNPGRAAQQLLQPKASVILAAGEATEFYLNAGRGFHTDDVRGLNLARVAGLAGAPLMARSNGEEVGMRRLFGSRLSTTLTVFCIDFASETTYNPDAGQDVAGPPSRRYGAELNLTYQALRWLEFYTSTASTHVRYRAQYSDGTGHVGTFIPDAPNVIASFAAYIKNRGAWSGGLDYRYFGAHSLTPDNAVRGDGYGELNSNIRFEFATGLIFGVGLYNVLNVRANAAEFWYVDRLPGESAGGVAGVHVHPLERRSVRLSVSRSFGGARS